MQSLLTPSLFGDSEQKTVISKACLKDVDPEVAALIQKETARKEYSLELIPSENCVSEAVLEATGSILTDKYCEGYPGKRYYGGCEHYDTIENLAIERAKQMFGYEAANVQPHSGSGANLAVYMAFMSPGDTYLGPRLDHGGHLTHGSPVNFSGRLYRPVAYGVNTKTGRYDADEVMALAKEHKPKMIVAGASAYPRQIDWAVFRRAADEVGAIMMADVAHYAGLIVGGAYESPFPHAHVVTTTTHKTLRGPRGGLILSGVEEMKKINRLIFPGTQGGPMMHQIAGKAVAFREALTPEFAVYAKQVVANARALADELMKRGYQLVSGGTDSHVMLIDLREMGLSGAEVETALGHVGITVNKNTIPDDPKPPSVTSGVRIGTPAITSRGFVVSDMANVAECIHQAIQKRDDMAALQGIRKDVEALCRTRPLFPHRLEKQ